jgi:type IV secretory pathway VirB10-like protein
MTEVDSDPVALHKSSHPLAQRPLLAAVALCSALLIGAIAMARSGAEHATEESKPDPHPIALGPADQAAEEVIRGMQKEEMPLYEQALDGPGLEAPPYEPPLARIEKTPAREQLEQALIAPSRIEFQTQTSFQAAPASHTPEPSEAPDLGYPAWPSLEGLTGEKDQPKYAQKAHFIRHGAEEWPGGYLQDGRKNPLTRYELKTGSVIPAVMISGINSDLPGQILAQVSEDIYDTATGRHLLIPQGSKVVGTYDNEVAFAQNRALVVWTKLIFPDASQVNLEGMPGADPSGYAGFRDKVNRHVGRRIGAALMMSVFNFAYEASRQQTQGPVGFQPESAVTAAVGQSIAELGKQMVEREMDVPNTLEIRPGYRFNVMVNKDIAFQSPYRRR